MRFGFLVSTAITIALTTTSGCSDDTSPRFDSTLPQPDFGSQVPPPILDADIPRTTCLTEVGITGTTQAGNKVFARGGASSGVATANASGRFCLAVRLNLDQENQIQIYATNSAGTTSQAATITVIHQSSPQCQTPLLDGGVPPEAENIALGATASAMEPPKLGATTAVNDGDPTTTAHWDSDNIVPWNAYEGWVSLQLEKPTSISKIVLRWRDSFSSAEKFYGSEYKILISATPEAGDPQLGGVWTTLATVTTGDGGEDVFEYKDTQPIALHVALWMEFGGVGASWDEQFVLGEFEVYDTPGNGGGPPPEPSVCAGAF